MQSQNALLVQLFFARDLICLKGVRSPKASPLAAKNLESPRSDTSLLKQRRQRKANKNSVVCASCSAEYHIDCLVQAYKDFCLNKTKS